MHWPKILAICLLTIFLLNGCLGTGQNKMPRQPTKPTLELQQNPKDEQGICLDSENTELLMDYIWRLEEGYSH